MTRRYQHLPKVYHWSENPVHDPHGLYIGEDERGDLWVPSPWLRTVDDEPWWGRRFNRHNPLHWIYWYRSWRDARCAYIESDPG